MHWQLNQWNPRYNSSSGKKLEVFLERPPIGIEYIYWISYRILNNNKPVIYDEENSYIERAYGVVDVSKNESIGKCKVKISVIKNLDDIKKELQEDLFIIKSIYQKDMPT